MRFEWRRGRPFALDERRCVEALLDDLAGVAMDGDKGVADGKQRRHDKGQGLLGDMDTEAAGADRDDAGVFRRDHALFDVLAPIFCALVQNAPDIRSCAWRTGAATRPPPSLIGKVSGPSEGPAQIVYDGRYWPEADIKPNSTKGLLRPLAIVVDRAHRRQLPIPKPISIRRLWE
jgi:hypothetical protein